MTRDRVLSSPVLPRIRCDALHVGMPKCGSTFLQQIGFAQHPGIALVWEPGLRLFFELRDQVDSPSFDLRCYSRRFAAYVDRRIADRDRAARVVISFEGFCGPQATNRNDRRLAETLKTLVGPTHVIFIVREQYRLLFSLWGQYVKEGGRLGLPDYLNAPFSPASPCDEQENIFLRVQYDRYVETLFRLFGRENVGVFFFEEFITHYEGFMRDLYGFIGADPDQIPDNTPLWRGPNRRNANLIRMLNRFSTSQHHAGLLPVDFYRMYRQWFERHVLPSQRWNRSSICPTRRLVPVVRQDQIRNSNRRLAQLLNRDIGSLGYCVR